MLNDDPLDDYEITPAQLKLKAFIDEHFKPEYRYQDYGIWCAIRFYTLGFGFTLTDQDDEDCQDILLTCKQYLRKQELKQKETALAGT